MNKFKLRLLLMFLSLFTCLGCHQGENGNWIEGKIKIVVLDPIVFPVLSA